jgi:hypothetical protein
MEESRLRLFGNRVLRRIFRTKKDKVAGEWRKLHNEALNDLYFSLNDLYCSLNDLYCSLNDLYFSPNIVRVIKLRRMRWAGHVARIEERRIQGLGGET